MPIPDPSPAVGLIVFVVLGAAALAGYLIGRQRRVPTPEAGQPPVVLAAPRMAPSAPPRAEAKLRAEVEELRGELAMLSSSSLGVAGRVDRLAQDLRRMRAQVEEVQAPESGPGAYGPAIKMAARGSDVEELIASFGLPRGEAELLSKLHGAGRPAANDVPGSRSARR